MENTIHPWIWMFLLPAAILFTLILIGWTVKKIFKALDENDIAL